MKKLHRKEKYILGIIGLFCIAGLICFFRYNNHKNTDMKESRVYTAEEIVAQMGIGWNLGNTFDATGGNEQNVFSQEQSWGNPIVDRELIHAVKEAGFCTIRIPVTWYRHLSEDGTYTIDRAFLDRIKTIVDYAYEEGMFVILNVHHEEWLNVPELDENYEALGVELSAIWSQLAEFFGEYDQHLIFEGMNEPRMAGTDLEWSGKPEAYAAVNYLNQVFVNTIRSSGTGYNKDRCLMIPGYAASSSLAVLESISIPTVNGEAADNIIISVHCYSPYDFCLSDARRDFNPEDSACTGEIDHLFSDLQTMFLNNGIPVVIGETGATNQDNTPEREKWAYYMGSKAAAYGIPIIVWDNGANGNSGGENHAYINRRTYEWNYPTVIQALMEGKNSIAWGTGRDALPETEIQSLLGGMVLWSDTDGLTSAALWDYTYIVMKARAHYYAEGCEVAVVYTGNGEPRLVLDSDINQVWWIPVEPERIDEMDGKKVAYFDAEDILREMHNAGVEKPDELRNMSVLAANDSISAYEVCILGGIPVVIYKVNGLDYAVGTELPGDPAYTNMEFLGWYTTRDYQPGTEYTGDAVSTDTTVYAKFRLTLRFNTPK